MNRLMLLIRSAVRASPTQATNYQYDALGNLTLVTQGTQTRSFSYSSLGRLLSAANPESGVIDYEYDATGNLTKKTDPRLVPNSSTRRSITYSYDDLGRVTARTYNDSTPNVSYSYDAANVAFSRGRLTAVSSSVSSYSYGEYDPLGRVKTGTQTTDGQAYTMSYSYNRAGALISQTYPSGRVVSTNYDGAGRLAGVKNDATGLYYAGAVSTDATNRLQYSAGGAIQAMKLGNGLWEHTNFNSRLQPIQIGLGTSSTDSSTLKLDYGYGVDTTKNNGNVHSQTITLPGLVLTQSYTYDELNRLKSAQELNGATTVWRQTYSYDRFGNRRFDAANTTLPQITPQNETSTNPAISSANNRISAAGYRYDLAGNLECDPTHPCGSTAPFPAYYEFDGDNRIKTANGGASSGGATYLYDGDGRRVKKIIGGPTPSTTVFVYDIGGQMIAEYSDKQPTGGGTSYLTTDHLGTPRVITRANGSVSGRHDYQPFGEEIAASHGGRAGVVGYPASDGLRQQFTLKERDVETGLDYFGARYYASTQGRFTSVDPMPIKKRHLIDPQDLNRYAYVANNPLKYIDPDGLEKIVVIVRTFIPAEKITHPPGVGATFKGDYNSKGERISARTEHRMVVETDARRPNSNNFENSPTVGRTERLAKGIGSISDSSEGSAGGDSMKAGLVRINDNSVRLDVKGDEANPLVSGSPGITYRFNITVSSEGETGRASVGVLGQHDGFPAYEIEVIRPDSGGTSTRVYQHDPNKTGDGPQSLYGSGEYYPEVKVVIEPKKKP